MHFLNSTFLDPETRKAMGEQAIALAKTVKYTSAGIYSGYNKTVSNVCKFIQYNGSLG